MTTLLDQCRVQRSLTTPTSDSIGERTLTPSCNLVRPRRGRRSPTEPWLVEEQGCTSQYGQHHRSHEPLRRPHDANCACEVGCQRFLDQRRDLRAGKLQKQLIRGTAWHRHDIVWLKLDQFIRVAKSSASPRTLNRSPCGSTVAISDTPSRLLRTRAWLRPIIPGRSVRTPMPSLVVTRKACSQHQ